MSWRRSKQIGTLALIVFLIWFYQCLPDPLFRMPTSTVLEDTQGQLLGARIATDGQWRFPKCDSVPQKFKTAIMLFEDEHFRKHPGVNPFSMARALRQNIREGRVVSGGSTITMQTIRLSRKGQSRTVGEKLIEVLLAFRLEIANSKDDILRYYASHAPFGGNVVGIDAAAWRYYGRAAHQLSWGEAATLAVLPNAPSLIYPGKNHQLLLAKRDRLLQKIRDKGIIDKFTCELAMEEELPQRPKPLPDIAPHLLQRITKEQGHGKRNRTTLNSELQRDLTDVLHRHHQLQTQNGIENGAILVLDVKTDEVIAYVGNTQCGTPDCGGSVDVITAPRSTGSILKPLLYAAAMDDGLILPRSLLPDVPMDISGFSPKNYKEEFDGVVAADNAIVRSLNVPAVWLLREYGLQRFHGELQEFGIRHINRPSGHYGLSLILGGAEASLWDICKTYKGLARSLTRIRELEWEYDPQDIDDPQFINEEKERASTTTPKGQLSAASIWRTFEVMSELNRPHQEGDWERFSASRRVAWKTGTSFGHRDAWAVGITPEYVVGVWMGNADGEGRTGLTGLNTAAPVLFDVMNRLPNGAWFEPPNEELVDVETCAKSGYRKGPNCPDALTERVPSAGKNAKVCTYHVPLHLDAQQQQRVNSTCYPVDQMVNTGWFVLPPHQAYFYAAKDPSYKPLPRWRTGCETEEQQIIQKLLPKRSKKIFIPRDIEGQLGRVVFQFAHRQPGVKLHWHLDTEYLGPTTGQHKQEILAKPGWHTLTVVDDDGNSLVERFEVVSR